MTLRVTKGGFLARTPFVLSPGKDIQPRPSYSHALMEVFSTPRLVPVAAARGLLAQHSLGKDSPAAWQADCAADRERARELVRSCRPHMLMLSPECTMYSIMQRNTNLARMDPAVVASRQQAADLHMKLCAELMVMQASAGRKFVLEHPAGAASWSLPCIQKLREDVPDAVLLTFAQCRFGLRDPDGKPLQKLTSFLTNMRSIIERFAGLQCICKLRGEGHGRIQGVVQGKLVSRWAQKYPAQMVDALVDCCQQDLA